jgi:hypothetical protein
MNSKAISRMPVISAEFFRRELGIDILVESDLPRNTLNENLIIVMNDEELEAWRETLISARKGTIVVLLIGSETLNLRVIRELIRYTSVRHVFVQYALIPSLRFLPQTYISFVLDFPRSLFQRDFYRSVYRGLKRSLKEMYLLMFNKISYMPLGYTDSFYVQAVAEGFIPENLVSSLFEMKVKNLFLEKKFNISFQGYKSGPIRRLVLNQFVRKPLSKSIIIFTERWGSSVGEKISYVNISRNSHMVISPPGHTSNLAFRHAEAAICGALPIAPICSLQDLGVQLTTNSLLPGTMKHSYYKAVKFVSDLCPEEKLSLVIKLREKFLDECTEFKDSLNKYLH